MIKYKDPTRTLTLRNKAAAEVRRRFNRINRVISQSLRQNKILTNADAAEKSQFVYLYDDEKLKGFMIWLEKQIQIEILTGEQGAKHWLNTYIGYAYAKGADKVRTDVARKYINKGQLDQSSIFANPAHIRRAELLYTRVYSQLKGVTDAMSQQIAERLSDGMIKGKGIREIAKDLNDRVDKIGKTRSMLIARTEIVNAHNIASLEETERLEGVTGEDYKMLWIAKIDGRTRDDHRHWHKTLMDKDIAAKRIGSPRCRCAVTAWSENWGDP